MRRIHALAAAHGLVLLTLVVCALPAIGGQADAAAIGDETITVIVVRHAERDMDVVDNPPLDEKGRARAEDLARALADAGVNAIYATQLQRTRLTAQPLALKTGISIQISPVDSEDIDSHVNHLADRIRSTHPGDTVLVVGHSNTVPLIVEALSGHAVDPIPDQVFDRLFHIRIPANGRPQLVRTRYGAASEDAGNP